MKLTIETRYNLDDKVIAYFKGEGFRKCKILDIITPEFSAIYSAAKVQYKCRTMESGDDIPTTQYFEECELFTPDELQKKINIMIENW